MEDGRPEAPRSPNVLIVTDVGFPHGTGASSRIFNYARGMQAAGARVRVLSVESPSSASSLNTVVRGEYRGVPFEYTSGRTTRAPSFLERRALNLAKGPRFALAALRWAASAGGLDAVLVYSRSPGWIALAWVGCRLHGAALLHEDCELPFVWRHETVSTALQRWLYERIVFKAFDGCLVISKYLDAYCRRHLRPGDRTLLVPILVDVDDVATEEEVAAAPRDRVAYCGYMDHREMRSVVDAFAAVAPEFPELRLQLIGGWLQPARKPALLARLRELGLSDRVDLTGKVSREELFALLRDARVHLLPRATASFSDAGLPTKVAEYLASGRPVVVTAVGDLPRYLTDGSDVYFAQSDDADAFAARLRDALEHPGEAAEVGRRGRETAKLRFDPATHGGRIVAFIDGLRRPRRREWSLPSDSAGPTGGGP